MKAAKQIAEQQRRWAEQNGHRVDAKGYLATIDANLWHPLNRKTREEFDRGKGSELRDRAKGPAKMRALHSSAALACNVFDFWRERDKTVLASALGIDGAITDLRFEKQLPTGLRGVPPNLDVFLTLEGERFVAIESKFTEQYRSKSSAKPFKKKYFPRGTGLWTGAGLPNCQAVAAPVSSGKCSFGPLNVAQLLKHALGAAHNHRGRVTLLYLFYDDASQEGQEHREDVARFSKMLRGEVSFGALSYQDLFRRLGSQSPGSKQYLEYLERRYFPGDGVTPAT